MQPMILFLLSLSLVSASPLLPYAYFSSPIPVTHHFQDTRTGVHAYSYAGGPSAKEEIKDADGVLRGSYSYIDANGILQSVFYVADEGGFRVAATNLPTDENLEADQPHIVLARNAEPVKSSRRKRSIEPAENSNQNDQTSQTRSSQSRQINLIGTQAFLTRDVVGIPLATSHQSQVQVHNNHRIDLPGEAWSKDKPVERQLILSGPTILGGVPVLARAPTYHENRIELHKQFGIEGSRTSDAVKIEPEPIAVLPSTLVAKEAFLPSIENLIPATSLVTSSISSHGITQTHEPSKQPIAFSGLLKPIGPIVVESKDIVPPLPILKQADLATATVTTSVSSHGVSQIHGNSKIEPSLLVKASPIGQLHPLIDVPIYIH